MRHGRKKPYTETGIKRCKCARCGKPAIHQWNICADKCYRPICGDCDVALNRLVLRFMNDPDWKEKANIYASLQ